MKVKMLVATVASSLLAASFACAAPSTPNTKLVDDATSSQQPSTTDSMQNPGAMDSNAPNSAAMPSDTTNNGASDSSNTNPSSDDTTPDTATGDAGDGDY